MKKISFVQLLNLAIKTLAEKEENRRRDCWIKEDPRVLHSTMKHIVEELKESLPPLQQLHFQEAGAFPYSSELSCALDLLQQSGLIRRENPSFDRFRPTWGNNTEEVVEQLRAEFFSGDNQALDAFNHFVERLAELRDRTAA